MNALTKINVRALFILSTFVLLFSADALCADNTGVEGHTGCLQCHQSKRTGFSDKHDFAASHCTSCHKGNETATNLPQAHEGLVGYPADMDHAEAACGSCHAGRVYSVKHSLMNTGKGIIAKTRHIFDETPDSGDHDTFSSIGHTPADSLLRKLCASCHLGQHRRKHELDVSRDQGGGCSACHINSYPKDKHPALTSQVEDGRCFSCHARSARVSLNYAGLAEIIPAEQHSGHEEEILQLDDGRTVVKRPADIHHEAGMSCIDCHTATGLMGGNDNTGVQRQAVDIRCTDCHKKTMPQPLSSSRPEKYSRLEQFSDPVLLTTAHSGTPLWHISQNKNGSYLLQPKLGGPALSVPSYSSGSHPREKEHARLHCSACHSQWAPQCYGCHLEYDPKSRQKDHLLQKETAGRWKQQRRDVRNGLPALGVAADNTIRPFVPGMIMSISHPDWNKQKFTRRFSSTEPHTTGKSRSCASCHRSSTALGLGQGSLFKTGQQWQFTPAQKILNDGLPADAWRSFEPPPAHRTFDGDRPFSLEEITRILDSEGIPSKPVVQQ